MTPVDEPARVECYAGGRGEETPRCLWVDGRWRRLTVIDRWMSEPIEGGSRIRWFRVRLEGGSEGLIYQDQALDSWFRRRGPGDP